MPVLMCSEPLQANTEARAKVFKAPNDIAFDVVFDFTSGSVTSGSTEEIMVQVSVSLALST